MTPARRRWIARCPKVAAGGIAAILSDICPAGAPDLEFLVHLRTHNPDAHIVVMTAYPSVSGVVASIRNGADDYLVKPLGPAQILKALQPRNETQPADTYTLPSLARIEWEYISRVLTDVGGNLSAAARVLGIRRSTLQRRLKKYPPRR